MRIRVLLADDHTIFQEGLRSLLAKSPEIDIVGCVSDGRTAVREAARLRPAVVIMDVSMPDLNGVDATRQITRDSPSVKVLCLSMHGEMNFVTSVLLAGASGYLLKDCGTEELMTAIRTVASGKCYLSAEVAGNVVKDYVEKTSHFTDTILSGLSEREREVLQLIVEGHSTKEIAKRLCLSVKTVGTHRQNIMSKVNVDSVAELTKCAIREGITSVS